MRIIAVNIGHTYIEFYNSMWTGHESIYVNGELVSKKFSWLGTDHFFEVFEDGEWVDYVLTSGIGMMGISTDIIRNGIPVVQSGRYGAQLSIPTPRKRAYYLDELV